jgi:basic amino acid/polyamine antiporter, APA family
MGGAVVTPTGPATTEGPLRRAISRRMLLFFILGDILGAGIYALVGAVAGEVGGAVWTAFMSALVLALFTAFAYAELITKYPRAGGAALFVNRAFGIPFLTFLVTFAVMASGITSASTLSRAFGGDYLQEFISVNTTLAALVFVGVVALINFRGIRESVRTNMVLTLVEVTGLVIIVAIGIFALGDAETEVGRNFEFKEGEGAFLAILAGTVLAFYALIGFEDSANVAEEAQDPVRNFPFALFAGIIIAGGIYFLVTFTASMVVPTAALTDSSAPLLEVVERGSGISTEVFSAIALLAIANGALINLVMASRLLYGMSNEGILPRAFSAVHPGRRTPWVAIIFTTLLAVLLISIGQLEDLAVVTVLLLLVVFAMVNIAVLVLRRERVDHAHFVAPRIFPILGVVISLTLLVKRVIDEDSTVYILLAVLIAVAVVLWGINRIATQGEPPSRSGAPDAP